MALSLDLRKRIVAAKDAGGSIRGTAARFGVSPTTVQNLLTLRRTTGSLEPRPHGGGHLGPPPELAPQLQSLLEADCGASLQELSAGTAQSVGRVRLTLRRLDITRKKRPSGPPNRTAPT